MGKYTWATGFQAPIEPSVAGLEISRIEAAKGHVTPADLVSSAMPELSPLHGCFEWDNDIAADKWRHEQARLIIANIRVSSPGICNGEPVRAFVSVPSAPVHGYKSTGLAVANTVDREHLLHEALGALYAWQRKYSHLRELSAVFDAANRTRQRVAA